MQGQANAGTITCQRQEHPLWFQLRVACRYFSNQFLGHIIDNLKDLIRDMTAVYVSFHDLSTPGEASSSFESSGKGEKDEKVIECFSCRG